MESGKHEQLMVLLALTGRGPDSGPRGLSPCCLMDLVCKCDVLFPLPVEEKAVFWIPRNARDCLFPLPVEENVISGLPCEGKEWACSDGSGCQPAFAPSDSPSSSKQIRAA